MSTTHHNPANCSYSRTPFHFSLFTVFQITFNTNFPQTGVQSHESNQLDRFYFAHVRT